MFHWRNAVFGGAPSKPVQISRKWCFLTLSSVGSVWLGDSHFYLLNSTGKELCRVAIPQNLKLCNDNSCSGLLNLGVEYVVFVSGQVVCRIGLPDLEVEVLEIPGVRASNSTISKSGTYVAHVDRETENRLFRRKLDPAKMRWISDKVDEFCPKTKYFWDELSVEDDGTVWGCKYTNELDDSYFPRDEPQFKGYYCWTLEAVKASKMRSRYDLEYVRMCVEGISFRNAKLFKTPSSSLVANVEDRWMEQVLTQEGDKPYFLAETRFTEQKWFKKSGFMDYRWFLSNDGIRDIAGIHNGNREGSFYSECELFRAKSSLRNLCIALMVSEFKLSPKIRKRGIFDRLTKNDLSPRFIRQLPNDASCHELAAGFLNWCRWTSLLSPPNKT